MFFRDNFQKKFNLPDAYKGGKVNKMATAKKAPIGYPDVITNLPEAQIAFEGAKAWIMQGEKQQLVFFEFKEGMDLPEHSHTYPQWGMVIDGKIELKIDGKPCICQKGDEYYIPAGGKHCAKFLAKTRVMDFFSEKSRYKPK